jgi:hypothetical protein
VLREQWSLIAGPELVTSQPELFDELIATLVAAPTPRRVVRDDGRWLLRSFNDIAHLTVRTGPVG